MLNKLPIQLSILFLGVLVFSSVFAEFLSPYSVDDEARELSYAPPTKIHFLDAAGDFHFIPFIYAQEFELGEFHERLYPEVKTHRFPIQLFIETESYKLWNLIPLKRRLFGVEEGARLYLFGADGRGRDLFSRVVMGSRISLSVCLMGVTISLFLALLVGGFAGYLGGRADSSLMRFAEIVMMFPGFYLLLAVRSSLPPEFNSMQIYFLVTIVLALIGWAPLSRVIRGMVLSIREREFIQAAKLLGTSDLAIVFKHIIPQMGNYLIVVVCLSIPGYIYAESALSMIGLGIQEPYVSWGMLLAESLSITQLKFHPWILLPGVFIFLTLFSLNYLGDSLRDWLDIYEQA